MKIATSFNKHSTTLLVLAALLNPAYADDWVSDWGDDWGEEENASPWQPFSGFVEFGAGTRLQSDGAGLPYQTLGEARGRIETGYHTHELRSDLRADLRYDDVVEGWQLDVRELSVRFSLGLDTDVKIGRQILTWGTGDFIFLNDLFPKDWQAFFSGLDDEYLKAPTNAVKVSYFGLGDASLDVAWMPRFEADNYLTGERFSFFSPHAGSPIAPGLSVDEISDDVWAARLYGETQMFGRSTEWALYGHWGYTGQPEAMDAKGQPAFALLHAYGASLVLPVGTGLLNLETSYHDYKDQKGGTAGQPATKLIGLFGYQQELIANLNLGVQYQVEHLRDYSAWLGTQPYPQFALDKNRHLLTTRLNYQAQQEKLILSLFAFYSPSNEDYYLRPQASYRWDDFWSFAAGFNLLGGNGNHTFFGQLADNSNAWLRVRLSY